MKVQEIIKLLENIAHKDLQESYDNSGLNLGNPNMEVTEALCTIDITEDVLNEAIELGANLIIAHHPLIFQGLKSITGKNYIEKVVIKAIQNKIAIYAGHTNFDNIPNGVNQRICSKLGLNNCKILSPIKNQLLKLATYVPIEYADKVRESLFDAGAGTIGKYDKCSYNSTGKGSFRGLDNATPFIGKKGELHFEDEIKIEVILPTYLKSNIVNNLLKIHPYEEVAYDLIPLANENSIAGAGMIGELNEPLKLKDLLTQLKATFTANGIRYTGEISRNIKKIAICGGSGAFLINKAKSAGADVFITGDVKYHQFFDADKSLILVDIGHYESEQFTKDIFYETLMKKIPKFAVHLSKVKTNPIKYFK
jgi:dinuclear metal center YbgI/SA1388 family protein